MEINKQNLPVEWVSFEEAEKFGINQLNRVISRSQVSRLKKGMRTSFKLFPPITINRATGNIIDGQHRHQAYLDLVREGALDKSEKLLVMYVNLKPEEEKEKIIDANTNSKNWSLDDYVLSYSKQGIESYKLLNEWCLKHELAQDKGRAKFRYGAAILTGCNCSSALKQGRFSVTLEQLERAEAIHNELLKIIEIFKIDKKGAFIEPLAVSWAQNRVNFPHTFKVWCEGLKKVAKSRKPLPKNTLDDWDDIFEKGNSKAQLYEQSKEKEKKS